MRSGNYVYVNGGLAPPAEACISVFDTGFLHGDGVFETMRVYGGRIFRFEQHMHRLYAGLERLRIKPPFSIHDAEELFARLCDREVTHGVARIYVTSGERDITGSGELRGNPSVVAWAWAKPLEPSPAPLRVMISSVHLDSHSVLAGIKSANRLPFVLASHEAAQSGMDEALLLNEKGHVVELSTANLFLADGGRLLTPPLEDGALPGITRAVVLELARRLGLTVREVEIKLSVLSEATEVFATNSVREIVPVAELNGRNVPSQDVALRLREAYRHLVQEECL